MLRERISFLLILLKPAEKPRGMAQRVKMTMKAGPASTWYSVPDPRYDHTHSGSESQLWQEDDPIDTTLNIYKHNIN